MDFRMKAPSFENEVRIGFCVLLLAFIVACVVFHNHYDTALSAPRPITLQLAPAQPASVPPMFAADGSPNLNRMNRRHDVPAHGSWH